MFGRTKKPPPLPPQSMRDTLFGDRPMNDWPPAGAAVAGVGPWAAFGLARDAVAAGRVADAVAAWRRVVDTPGLESRHTLQAWHFLRAHGVQPSAAQAKQLLGVVLEVPVNNGLDLLAAYPEHTARYYNYSGAGVVWERPNDSLDAPIDALLHAGQRVLDAIGPTDKPRPAAPTAGQIRLNFLSPAGLHFGQGPYDTLADDPMARPVIAAGVALMNRLTTLPKG